MLPSILIIGHGDSPLGCKWGSEIDKNVVFRLKDPSWQHQNRVDYGHRTDYMAASTETMLQMLDCRAKPLQYYAQPKRGSWNSTTEGSFRARTQIPLTIPIELHNQWNGVFKGLTESPAPNHSLGMAAIVYAAFYLKPAEILLMGFDNLLDPARLDYFKANKGKWPSRHYWTAENKMLPMIETAYNVRIGRFGGAGVLAS